jgi:glycine dehydrogenase subunit 1
VVLCLGAVRKRSRVVIAGDLDPRYRETLATYLPGLGAELVEVPADPAAVMEVAGEAAVVVAQHPDFSGRLTDVPALAEAAHDAGAKLLVSFDLLLAGVLAPPGRLGADVVTADGLSAGNTLSYGGPGCGLLACRAEDVRRLPGRLVGQTVDADGNRAFVLTLQAREQHIRREKATSNICTNQSLNALAVAVYLSWLGPQGLVALGEACLAGAAYARERLQASGIELADPDAAVGKEFAVRVPDPASTAAALAERGYLVGPVAGEDRLLVAVTEQRTRDEIDALAKAFAEVAGESGR